MRTKPAPQAEAPKDQQRGPAKREPWLNTKPRENPETNAADLKRSVERFEMLLGR